MGLDVYYTNFLRKDLNNKNYSLRGIEVLGDQYIVKIRKYDTTTDITFQARTMKKVYINILRAINDS